MSATVDFILTSKQDCWSVTQESAEQQGGLLVRLTPADKSGSLTEQGEPMKIYLQTNA